MTPEQIQTYEYCKKDLAKLSGWRQSLPFTQQNHGCGSNVPQIEYNLERVHRTMYNKVIEAMDEAEKKIIDIIESL